MKLTKRKLNQLIKEELKAVLTEASWVIPPKYAPYGLAWKAVKIGSKLGSMVTGISQETKIVFFWVDTRGKPVKNWKDVRANSDVALVNPQVIGPKWQNEVKK